MSFTSKKQVMKALKKKGFTLIETMLVLVLITIASTVALKMYIKTNEEKQAIAEGERIKELGSGLAEFMAQCYGGFTSIPAGSSGVIALSAYSSNTKCSGISVQATPFQVAAANDSLIIKIPYTQGTATDFQKTYFPNFTTTLKTSFDNASAGTGGYSFIIQRIGSGSGATFKAMVATNKSWRDGNGFKGDLIGLAIKKAGNNAASITDANGSFVAGGPYRASGHLGNWVELVYNSGSNPTGYGSTTNATYGNEPFANAVNGANPLGRLVYRVYVSSLFDSVYLRRDGQKPMIGDLCMAKDSAASGNSLILCTNAATSTYANITTEYAATTNPKNINGVNWLRGNGALFYTTNSSVAYGSGNKVIIGSPEVVGANADPRISMVSNASTSHIYANQVNSVIDFDTIMARSNLVATRINPTTAAAGLPATVPSGAAVPINNVTVFGNYATTGALPDRKYTGFGAGTSVANTFNNAVQDGLIRARDVLLEDMRRSGTSDCGVANNQACGVGWLSDRLPRYSSRGVFAVNVPNTCTTSSPASCPQVVKPACPTNATPKIEVVPQIQWIQGKVLGNLGISGSYSYSSGAGISNLTVNVTQNQHTLGSLITYAADLGVGSNWRIHAETPQYFTAANYPAGPYVGYINQYTGGAVLAHIYCDFGA